MSGAADPELPYSPPVPWRELLEGMSSRDQNYFVDPPEDYSLPLNFRAFALHCSIEDFGKMAHLPLLLIVNYATPGGVVVDGHFSRLEPGHALLVSSGHFHDYEVLEEDTQALWLFLNFEMEHSERLDALTLAPTWISPQCQLYLEALVRGYAGGAGRRMNPNFRAQISLLAALVLETLLEEAQERRIIRGDGIYRKGPVQPYRILQRASEYIRQHLLSPLAIEDIAAALGISSGHLRNVFHDCLEIGPAEYVQYVRLQQACMLMDTTGMSLSEIAASCGYNSLSAFSRAFRKNRGMAPREYRLRYPARSAKRKP